MKELFSHIILTRFNLRTMTREGLTEKWLAHRVNLFRTFCFPSVVGQTNQEFKWLCLFDAETPKSFLPAIQEFAEYKNFSAEFVSGFDVPAIQRHVLKYVPIGSRYLITTTLDNDDAIGLDFVKSVQAGFNRQEFEFVNLVNGYVFSLCTRKLYESHLLSNPFISLIEKNNGEPKTIMGCYPHHEIPETWKAPIDVQTSPAWLQIVHEINVNTNHTFGLKRAPVRFLDSHFRTNYAIRPECESLVAAENMVNLHTAVRGVINHVPLFCKRRVKDWLQRWRHAKWRGQ